MNRRTIYLTAILILAIGFAISICWWIGRPLSYNGAVTANEVAEAAKKWGNDTSSLSEKSVPNVADPQTPIRLAIGSLGMTDDEQNRRLGDLVLANLNNVQGLTLVERQSLNVALAEIGLNLSGLVRAKDAVRAGKLLKADWFLLGTESKIGATNSIVIVRLVDAHRGILYDSKIISADKTTVELSAEISAFVEQCRQNIIGSQPKSYLAIGGFDDVSLNNQQVDFPNQLRAYLTEAYQKSHTTLLEREAVEDLFKELSLDLAGLLEIDGVNKSPPVQSTYWLVQGSYQAMGSFNSEVEVTVDVSGMFGMWSQPPLIFRGKPDVELFKQIKEGIDARLNTPRVWTMPKRAKEVRAQMELGKKLAALNAGIGLPSDEMSQIIGLIEPEPFQNADDQESGRRHHNAEQAIHAFETVLLLEPDNSEAKLYLAACFRKQTVDRFDEARAIYREIIERPVSDQWTGPAQQALKASFEWRDEPDAIAQWFSSAVKTTANPAARTFYEQQIEPAALQSALDRADGDDVFKLAKKQLMTSLHDPDGYWDGRWSHGISDFVNAFGADKKIGADKLATLLPEMETVVSNTSPQLIAIVLEFQTDTNTSVLAEFRSAMDRCIKKPATVPEIRWFWQNARSSSFDWLYKKRLYSDAVKLMEGYQQEAQNDPDSNFGTEDRIALAFAYKKVKRWNDALAIFESYSNTPVLMCIETPWGDSNLPVQTAREANRCREQLGLPAIHDSKEFEAKENSSPICLLNDATFACDQAGVWLGSGNQLVYLDWNLKTNFSIDLPKNIFTSIAAICVTSSNVWLATGGDGLLAFDKNTRQCRRFTVKDGMMMDAVSSLSMTGDKLWIGYGYNLRYDRQGISFPAGGGIGCLVLASNYFISFQPSLTNGTDAQKNLAGNLVLEPQNQPTRRVVRAIAAATDGQIWFIDEENSLRHFQSVSNVWEAIGMNGECLALDKTKLLIGQTRSAPSVNSNSTAIPSGVGMLTLQNGQWENIDHVGGLPSGTVSAITLDDDNFWIGGTGFIGLVDAKQKQVKQFAYLPASSIKKIQSGGGYLWAQYNGLLHRLSP